MRIEHIRTITGPNVISHNPVLRMRLDLQELTGKESYELPGFIDRLLAALPGVREHYCGKGYAGGFVGPPLAGLALDLMGRESVAGWGVAFGHLAVITLTGLAVFQWLGRGSGALRLHA